MKGIQVKEAGLAEVVDLPQPRQQDGYAIVKVMAASICGTDVSTFRGINVNVSSYPIVIGHETAGIVEDVDENNKYGIKKGDRVVLDPYLYCGECYPCSQGKTNCCETLRCLGVHCDGSMCEYFAHPVHMLRKGKLVIFQPKTKAANRAIILPAPLLSVLKEYRQQVHSCWLFPSPRKDDLPLDPASVRKHLTTILERAGCKHIRFHDLRHPYVKPKTKKYENFFGECRRNTLQANGRPLLMPCWAWV